MRRLAWLGLLAALAAGPAAAQESPPNPPAASAMQQRQGDTRIQQALRRVLGVLMQQYGDLTGKVPDSLNDADIAMREAVQALDAGNDPAAAAAIRTAIEALQKGGQSMSQQLARQFGGQPRPGEAGDDEAGEAGDEQAGDDGDEGDDGDGRMEGDRSGRGPSSGQDGRWDAGRTGERRDPLGRRLHEEGTGQSLGESGVRVPDQMELARSHAIQEELRRREAEKTRPQPELDYIERLLRQY
jgi:hypothetical protein